VPSSYQCVSLASRLDKLHIEHFKSLPSDTKSQSGAITSNNGLQVCNRSDLTRNVQVSLHRVPKPVPFAYFRPYLAADSTVAGAVGGVDLISLLLSRTGVAAVSVSAWLKALDRGLTEGAPDVPLPDEELRLTVSGERSLL